jgi:hypothetical protein
MDKPDPEFGNNSGIWNRSVLLPCNRVGAVLGVALDLIEGSMRVAVLDAAPAETPPVTSDWKVAFKSGVCPGEAVGSGIYPAVSGNNGVQIKYNLGDNQAYPLRHSPPSSDYKPVGATMGGQVCVDNNLR